MDLTGLPLQICFLPLTTLSQPPAPAGIPCEPIDTSARDTGRLTVNTPPPPFLHINPPVSSPDA